MTRRSYTPKAQISRAANHTAAFAKAGTARLETLTPAMLESIAASHARRGTPLFDKLLVDLSQVVEMRRSMAA